MQLIPNPKGNYAFLTGIAPYSSGVKAEPGYQIIHATMGTPIPYRAGFLRIREHLESLGRPLGALCAVELRSPKPFSFEGFARFNEGYQKILVEWDLLIDGKNPVARTHVAPETVPPEEPSLYAFSYTAPCEDPGLPPTFVIAGAGELMGGKLAPEAVVRAGESSPDAIREKAEYVMGIMQARLSGLNLTGDEVSAVDVYTVYPLHTFMKETILKPMGKAAIHGIRWHYSRPPIADLQFEMDMRAVHHDIRLT